MKYSRLTFRSLGIPIATMLIDIFGAEEIMWMPDVVAGEPFDESLDSGTGIVLKEVLQWNIQL